MLHAVPAKQMRALSKKGTLAWRAYCAEKEWGSVFDDGDYIEIIQPILTHLLEYAIDNKLECIITTDEREPILYAWRIVSDDLER